MIQQDKREAENEVMRRSVLLVVVFTLAANSGSVRADSPAIPSEETRQFVFEPSIPYQLNTTAFYKGINQRLTHMIEEHIDMVLESLTELFLPENEANHRVLANLANSRHLWTA